MRALIEPCGPGAAVCRLSGALDAERSCQLRATMVACAAFDELYLDLSGVRFVDSAAVADLVGGVRRVRDTGGVISVCGARKNIRRHLAALGFERVAPIQESVRLPTEPLAAAG